LIEQYQKVIGENHARRWGLPVSVVEVINYIDDLSAALNFRMQVTTINATRLLADISVSASQYVGFAEALSDQSVFDELNLYE